MSLVIDASVFNKLFLNEPDRPQAQALFRAAIMRDVTRLAPQILLYEALSSALHYGTDFAAVLKLLNTQRDAGMRLLEPNEATLIRAQEIVTSGHPKSGHPGLADSIYHALAIETDSVFVTADSKHLAKAQSYGHIAHLSAWESLDCFAVEQ